jgi:predicted transcriptional regulator
MNDLIKRLRQAEDSKTYVSEGDLWNLCGEAADEIEKLQQQIADLLHEIKQHGV